MSAKQRCIEPGYVYHVVNRSALRQRLFFDERDYTRFESLIEETLQRTPLSILTYQLMPNHWHFVVQPQTAHDLSNFFQYLAGTHAKRFRVALDTVGEGHVYQDRFKSFPVQSDGHLLAVCRYVERNALRARLVSRAENWRWGGLWRRLHARDTWLKSDWPVQRPADWLERVNQPLSAAELQAIQRSIRRGRPYGSPEWTRQTAEQLGLMATMRRVGRPRLIDHS